MRSRYWIPVLEWSFCGKDRYMTPLALMGSMDAAKAALAPHGYSGQVWICDMSNRIRNYVESLIISTRTPALQQGFGAIPLKGFSIIYCVVGQGQILQGLFTSRKEATFRIDANNELIRFRTAAPATQDVMLGLAQEVSMVEEWR